MEKIVLYKIDLTSPNTRLRENMALVVPNTADVLFLKFIVGFIRGDGGATNSGYNKILHLYTNNLTPTKATAYTDVTEATQAGYAAITLTGPSWTVGTNTAGTNVATYSAQTFTFTTAVTCYGYFMTSVTSDLLWVERFSTAPFTLPAGGGEIEIVPQLTLD